MIGQQLRALRQQLHISQSTLAQAMGVTQQAVGKWETGRSAPDPDMVRRLAGFFSTTTDEILGYSAPAAAIPAYHGRQEHPIPIIGTVRAGWGSLALEEDCGVEYASVKDPENYFFLVVKGDSMSPRIENGDLALVRRQSTLESGDLGVCVVGEGEGTLKKYIRSGNTVILQPFNPTYQPLVLAGEELDRLCIAGKVVETKTKW